MQIHELNQKPLHEAGLADLKSFAQAALNQNPNMAGMNFNQRMKTLAADQSIQKLSKVMAQQWLTKANLLLKQVTAQQAKQNTVKEAASGFAAIDENTYEKYLVDFVNKNMFRGQMRYLQPESKSAVEQDIREIVKFRNDPARVTELFLPLAQTAALSLMTAPGALTAPAASAAPAATGTTAAPAAKTITAQTLKSTLSQMGVNIQPGTPALQQFFEKASGDVRVDTTGNEYADALLEIFGFMPQ